jgi:hypothetical protein
VLSGVVIAGGYLGLTDPDVMSMLVYHPPRHLLPLLWMVLDVILECGSCLLILGSKGVVVSTLLLGMGRCRRRRRRSQTELDEAVAADTAAARDTAGE